MMLIIQIIVMFGLKFKEIFILQKYKLIGTNHTYNLYVNGSTLHNGTIYLANGTTYYIDNSAVAYLNDLRVDNTRLVDNWLGFYQSGNAGGSRYAYIQGA